jgi:hypothetical protein
VPLGGGNPAVLDQAPFSYGRIPQRLRVDLAASGEVVTQTLRGAGAMPNGAGGFVTGPQSLTQFYVPLRFNIGVGRGVNTQGAITGSVTEATGFEPKRPTSQAKKRSRRGG